MKPIADGERSVINIDDARWEPFTNTQGETDGYFLQHDRSRGAGTGFYIYKMDPGHTTEPHRHLGVEEFLILKGDLTDNDGTVYREGDFVSLKAGTEHSSHSEHGCLIAVYSESFESEI